MRQANHGELSKRFLTIAVLLLLAVVPAARAQTRVGSLDPAGPADIQIVRSDETGLIFELRTPPFTQDNDGALRVAGLDMAVTTAGAPALPLYRAWISLPPQAAARAGVTTLAGLSQDVTAVPPVPLRTFAGAVAEEESLLPVDAASLQETRTAQPDKAIYNNNGLYPEAAYTLSAPQQVGDLRLVQITLFPLRYNPVRGTIEQATHLRVAVAFSGAALDSEAPPAAVTGGAPDVWESFVLNPPPANWRVRPQAGAVARQETAVTLPQGQPVYKIEVTEDGIYEISGAALAAAGMNLGGVAVNTLQMMHRGQPVAYQFINAGGGAAFEPQDKIRFYGWAFDGSRYEDMFVDRNYYWLWAGGTPTLITAVPNETAASHQARTSFPSSVTSWPHLYFYTGGATNWDASPNEATPWHMARINGIKQTDGAARTFYIDLPDPVPVAANTATVTAEVLSRQSATALSTYTYTVSTQLNGVSTGGSSTWEDEASVNIIGNVAGNVLRVPGDNNYPRNDVRLAFGGSVAGDVNQSTTLSVSVTRITVDYERKLLAAGNELQFGADSAGAFAFAVEGFSENSSVNALVWDVSNRRQPVAIALAGPDMVASAGAFRWNIRRTLGANGRILATTTANTRPPAAISQVVPTALEPAGGAAWVAISHSSLLPTAQALAAHRATQSGLSTWVVDVQQIIDQIGYGYHLPTAIRSYMKNAYDNWDTPPAYLTLVGDATYNPRYLDCLAGCGNWDANKPHLVAAELLFADRFAGLIPVDHAYAMLDGEDYYPDISVARLPAVDLLEAQAMVDKIVRYETNFDTVRPEQNHFLFVADNADGGGNFCQENAAAVSELPQSVSTTQLCLPNVSDMQSATNTLRTQMFAEINNVGALILNYRGHGSIDMWAVPAIMDTDDTGLWQNAEPMVVISADCWDGNFTFPDVDGLGETYFGLSGAGSAAHWSSAGLGYSVEHSILHSGFYHAIFHERLLRIGDAVKYAKINYLNRGQHPSEVFAFTLLGDPAMGTVAPRADLSGTVSLQGRADTAVTPGTVKLIDLDGNFAPQTVSTTAVNGSFILRGVPVAPGGSNYRLEAGHALYLSAAFEQTITAEPLTLPNVMLRGGDANNDASVNILDLSCMGGMYNVGVGTCAGKGSTDLNGDGRTNISDLSMAGGNYQRKSFLPWQP